MIRENYGTGNWGIMGPNGCTLGSPMLTHAGDGIFKWPRKGLGSQNCPTGSESQADVRMPGNCVKLTSEQPQLASAKGVSLGP